MTYGEPSAHVTDDVT